MFFELAGIDTGMWQQIIYYRREEARVKKQGIDYPPLKYIWPGPDRNILP